MNLFLVDTEFLDQLRFELLEESLAFERGVGFEDARGEAELVVVLGEVGIDQDRFGAVEKALARS